MVSRPISGSGRNFDPHLGTIAIRMCRAAVRAVTSRGLCRSRGYAEQTDPPGEIAVNRTKTLVLVQGFLQTLQVRNLLSMPVPLLLRLGHSVLNRLHELVIILRAGCLRRGNVR